MNQFHDFDNYEVHTYTLTYFWTSSWIFCFDDQENLGLHQSQTSDVRRQTCQRMIGSKEHSDFIKVERQKREYNTSITYFMKGLWWTSSWIFFFGVSGWWPRKSRPASKSDVRRQTCKSDRLQCSLSVVTFETVKSLLQSLYAH